MVYEGSVVYSETFTLKVASWCKMAPEPQPSFVHSSQKAGRRGNGQKGPLSTTLPPFKRALPEVTSLHVIGQNLFTWPHVVPPKVQKCFSELSILML